jgi:hypothetical protein
MLPPTSLGKYGLSGRINILLAVRKLLKIFNSRWAWHLHMKGVIDNVLSSAYPRSWDEDFITRDILRELRKEYKDIEITQERVMKKSSKLTWDIFKNTKKGKIEQKYGDIGIIVQILYPNGNHIEGVAFIEAKRIYYPEVKFTGLKLKQLKTLSNNSFSHRTVFYDYIQSSECGEGPLALGLPTKHLIALDNNTRDIYPYCEQFSYILTNRYLQGYELDYAPDSINSLKGFADASGGVDYLIVSQITASPDMEPSITNIEFNRDLYISINGLEPDDDYTPTSNNDDFTM